MKIKAKNEFTLVVGLNNYYIRRDKMVWVFPTLDEAQLFQIREGGTITNFCYELASICKN